MSREDKKIDIMFNVASNARLREFIDYSPNVLSNAQFKKLIKCHALHKFNFHPHQSCIESCLSFVRQILFEKQINHFM